MKKYLKWNIVVLLICLSSCKNSKQIIQNPPFTVAESYFLTYNSGTTERVSGIEFYLNVPDKPEAVNFSRLYFKSHSAKLQKTDDQAIWKAILKKNPSAQDKNVSIDMREEAQNPLPQINQKPPIHTKEQEAVLVYRESGKEWYYIIKDIRDRGSKNYPVNTKN